jgi:hypothetical protein
MPIMDNSGMETHNIGGSGFGFSAKRIGILAQKGTCEYTLVTLAVDATGSVQGWQDKEEKCIKEVVKACRKSPRADNLLLRVITFNSGGIYETHGFKPLMECDPDKYTGTVVPGGMTNLYDAAYSSAGAMNQYGKDLSSTDFSVNGIFIVITDGDDNASKTTPTMLKDEIAKGVSGESLESVVSILVGVNVQEPRMSARLQAFQADAGFTQYVEVENATDGKIAKLADFVSRSVSSQSQALGSGGPSKTLSF